MSNTSSNTGTAGREGSNLITSPLTYFLSKETDKHPLSESDTESDLPLYLDSISETCSYNGSVDMKSQRIGHTFSVDTAEINSPCLEDDSNLDFQHSFSNIHLLSDAALTKLIASSSPALIHRIISSYCSDIRRAHTILAEKDIEIKSIREQWSRLNHSTSDSHLNQNVQKRSFNVTTDKQLEFGTDTDSGWFLESRSSDYSTEIDQPRTSSSSVPSTPFRTPSPLSSSSTWPKHSRSLSLSSPIPSINSHRPVRTSIENRTVDLLQANSTQSQYEDSTENKLDGEVDHNTTNPNEYQPSLARERNLHTTDDIISTCSSKAEVNPCSMEYMDGREETQTPNNLLPIKLTSGEPISQPLHFKAIALAIKLLNPDGSAPAKLYINSKRMSTLLSRWTIDLLNGEKARTPSIINTCTTEEATLCPELTGESRNSIYLDNFELNERTFVSKLPVVSGIDNPRTKESKCPSSAINNLAVNTKIPPNKTTLLEPKSIPRYSHLSLVKPEILYPIDCHGFYSNTTLLASTGNPTHALYSPPNSPTITPATITVTKDTSQNPSVHQLLSQLMDMHDVPQLSQKEKWDAFVERRRAVLAKENNGGDGTIVAEQGIGLIGMGEAEYKEFKKLVRAGIPAIYRAKVWEECAGAYDRKKVGYYSGLLARHENQESVFLNQIELDLPRTLPNNPFFGRNGDGIEKLRRILVAYSWHNPSIGYCQGMNLIAATLLLTESNEEDAFWTLLCLIEHILPSEYYAGQLLVSQADQRVLEELVKETLPCLDSHFGKLGVDLGAATSSWFLTIYADCFPPETLFRVWDIFFTQGMITLFRVAVALLKIHEKRLLGCQNSNGVYDFLNSMTRGVCPVEQLIEVAFVSLKPSIKRSVVQSKRDRLTRQIKQEFDMLKDVAS